MKVSISSSEAMILSWKRDEFFPKYLRIMLTSERTEEHSRRLMDFTSITSAVPVVGSKQKNEITAGEMSFCPDIIGYGLSLSDRVRSLVILEGLRGVLLPLQLRWFGDLTRILTWLYNWKEAPDSMLGRLCLSAWLGMPQCPPKRAGGGGWREGGNSA